MLALPEVELRAVLSVPDPKVWLLAIRPALALPKVVGIMLKQRHCTYLFVTW